MVDKTDVLDSDGMDKMLEELFSIIEGTYIRRSTFEDYIEDLNNRVDEIINPTEWSY